VEAEAAAVKTGKALKSEFRVGKIDYLEYLAKTGESEAEVTKAKGVLEAFNTKELTAWQKVKARASSEIDILKRQGGQELIDKLNSLKPSRKLADKLEQSKSTSAFYKELKAAADTNSFKIIKQGEATISSCAKLGMTIDKAAVGIQ
jgi:hypothetical protein